MVDRSEHEDRMVDRNLRRVGQRLQLPADPTARQQAAWRQASEATRDAETIGQIGIPERGVRFMKRHRILTIATSAVAACIVLTVLLYTPRGSVVEARTIFNSLRQTLLDGFQITFEDVGDDGIHATGKVVMTLEAPADTPGRIDPAEFNPKAIYVDVHAWGDETNADLDGLDVQVNLALSDETQWVYLKTMGLPAQLLEEEPMAWLVVGMTSSGILLELDGLVDGWNGEHAADEEARAVAAMPSMDFQPNIQVTDDGDMEKLFSDFLLGRATGEQVDEIYALISEAAETVSVVEDGAGLYVLTARDFKFDEDDDAAELLGETVLRIEYREGSGIESALLDNFGCYKGRLLIEPLDELDPGLFDKEHVIEPGVTKVLDLEMLSSMFQNSMPTGD